MAALGAARALAAAPGPPVNVSLPTVSGTTEESYMLTASSGAWSSATPITFAYQWQLCDATGANCLSIDGATGPTYATGSADVGGTLRVAVTATNADGSTEAVSDPTAVIAPASAPANTAAPTISGDAKQGKVLTAQDGAWTGTPPIAFAYEWLLCSASGGSCSVVSGATSSTYTPTAADVGSAFRVAVTASNIAGSSQAFSEATPVVVVTVPPVNTAPPTISGQAFQGKVLTAGTGTWTSPTTITSAYQWRSCDSSGGGCSNIDKATGATYTLGSSDVGHRLRVAVTATNADGSTEAVSDPSATVVDPAIPVNTSLPTISGTPREGQSLTASEGSWTSSTPVTTGFVWTRCGSSGSGCITVAGATSRTYTLTSIDVGRTLRVTATATNSAGQATASSNPTGVVTAAAAAATSVVATPKTVTEAKALPKGAITLRDGRISIRASSVLLPARLAISSVKLSQNPVDSPKPFTARFRVTDTRGYVVRNALVRVRALDADWIEPLEELRTGRDGFVLFRIRPTDELPLDAKRLALVIDAHKAGEKLGRGVSARRVVKLRLDFS